MATGLKVTLGLLDGQTKTGILTDYSPNQTMLRLALPAEGDRMDPLIIPISPERVAYVGFSKGTDMRLTPPGGQTSCRVHVAGGKSFHVTASPATKESRGFVGYPLESDSPFSVIYFYNHGVNAREKVSLVGAMLLENGKVAARDLEQALAAQDAGRKVKVGEILLEQKKIAPQALEDAANLQKRRGVRIGQVLVEAGYCTEEDVQAALAEQRVRKGKRVGELLLEMGHITELDLASVLAKKFNLPVIDLDQQRVDAAQVQDFPRELVEKYGVLPLASDKHSFTVAISDPLAIEVADALRFSLTKRIVEVVSTGSQLKKHVERYLAKLPAPVSAQSAAPVQKDVSRILEELTVEDTRTSAPADADAKHEQKLAETDTGIIGLANQIIVDAYRRGASDIHVEPNGRDRATIVRMRIDGECVAYQEIPAAHRGALTARLKIMARLDIAEKRKPQDGKIRFPIDGKHIELRVATIPTVNDNEDIVMRILAAAKSMPLSAMGLSQRNFSALETIIQKPYGLVLCVGPTGSGKTTTLHAALGAINKTDTKIWTAEDPVEITQPGLRQVQVNSKIGFTFAAAMRAFLRADPDVIMVGEMRDLETAATAIEASLTGHLVFSTLHTNNAPETVTRLIDMKIDPFGFADSLLGVLAQRLTRGLCRMCAVAADATPDEVEELSKLYGEKPFAQRFGLDQGRIPRLWHTKGCDACGNSGYKGRIALHELLVSDETIKRAIQQEARSEVIREAAIAGGMTTLLQDGIEKCLAGLTDSKQVLAVCSR